MATPTDGRRAHDILLSYEPLSRHGACWYYVWQAYAAAGASTGMGSTPTAYQGWQATQGKHPGDWNPPPGAAIWLGRRYDGNMDGDVFIAGQWDGDHAATDQPTYGKTGTTTLQARINLCGREYLGWSDHVLDCPILGTETDGFLMALSDDEQRQLYAWVQDTQNRVRGSDPNADILQIIDANARDVQIRVRGTDPNVDMLQDTLGRVKSYNRPILIGAASGVIAAVASLACAVTLGVVVIPGVG